jgi:hypothetical protein
MHHSTLRLAAVLLALTTLGWLEIGRVAASPWTGPFARQAASMGHLRFGRPDSCGKAVIEPISAAGGVFKLPPCGRTTGKLTYGPNDAPSSAKITLTSSTQNPDPSVCQVSKHDTVFFPFLYVLGVGGGDGSITFNSTAKNSKLRNTSLPPDPYSLFAYANNSILLYESLGSPNRKGVLTFASPFTGHTIPLGVTICFEFGLGP